MRHRYLSTAVMAVLCVVGAGVGHKRKVLQIC